MQAVTARMSASPSPGAIDPVRVPDPEPALRDLGHFVPAVLYLVLVVDVVSFRLHVLPVGKRDGQGRPIRKSPRRGGRRIAAWLRIATLRVVSTVHTRSVRATCIHRH